VALGTFIAIDAGVAVRLCGVEKSKARSMTLINEEALNWSLVWP
jgi:hypothetical protein